MKKCPQCNQKWDDQFNFCPKCRIALVESESHCPVCNAILFDGFCPVCGKDFSSGIDCRSVQEPTSIPVGSQGLKYIANSDGITCTVYKGTCTDENIIIPPVSPDGKKVTRIGVDAFTNRYGLISITIPNSVTSIGDRAFDGLYSLKSITIPNSVTIIGDHAFCSCGGLKSINFNGTKQEWKSIIKGYCWKVSTGFFTVHCTDGNIVNLLF